MVTPFFLDFFLNLFQIVLNNEGRLYKNSDFLVNPFPLSEIR